MAHTKIERGLYTQLKRKLGHIDNWEQYIPAVVAARTLVQRFRCSSHKRRVEVRRRASPANQILGRNYFTHIRVFNA